MKFQIEIPNKLKLHYGNHATLSRNQKIQYGCQAAILKVASLEIDRLLPIHTGNMLLFGSDIQNQIRVQKLKNPIWPPGSHFESDIAENQ